MLSKLKKLSKEIQNKQSQKFKITKKYVEKYGESPKVLKEQKEKVESRLLSLSLSKNENQRIEKISKEKQITKKELLKYILRKYLFEI
ncbi:MAG: hypothetical protein ACRC6U_10395 [Fusobacteriaceae bacterium]